MRNPLLVPDLKELIHSGETAALREFFAEYHPARVAEVVEDLEPTEGDAIFGLLDPRHQAEVMGYLDDEAQVRLAEAMAPEVAAALLHIMSHDERADLFKRLDEDHASAVSRHLAHAEREDIRRLSSYEPGTAGAVMTTDYVTLPPELTVREALDRIRLEAPDRETIYYNYVIDEKRRLLGLVSLKALILARPRAHIAEIMKRDIVMARVDDDQEAVAQQIEQYDLIAIPILDAADMLVGIVTHDDAMDILRREQTEDILRFGGVAADPEADDSPYWQSGVLSAVRRRLGWLGILFFAELGTGFVSRHYEWVALKQPHLIHFTALLIGTGGNAGSQVVGTIIRGLSLGEITAGQAWRVVAREWLTGALLGLALGGFGFFQAWVVRGEGRMFSLVIAATVLCICMWANTVGAMIPLLAHRLGRDPAVVSAPLITTLVDATGLAIFYSIAIVLLNLS